MSNGTAGVEALSQQLMADEHGSSKDGKLKFIHQECLNCIKSSHDLYSDDSSRMLKDAVQKIDQLEKATDEPSTQKQLSNIKTALQSLSLDGAVTLDKMRQAVDLGLQDKTPTDFHGGVHVQLSTAATISTSNSQNAQSGTHDQHEHKKSKSSRTKALSKDTSMFSRFSQWLKKLTQA